MVWLEDGIRQDEAQYGTWLRYIQGSFNEQVGNVELPRRETIAIVSVELSIF